MAERYDDEDDERYEDELEDQDQDDLDDDEDEDEELDQEDEVDGAVIEFGPVDRQAAEAKAKRVPVRINATVYKFLPAEQWSYTTWKAVDAGRNQLPDFTRWARGVLPKSQVRSFLALDMDLKQYSDLVQRIQRATEAKQKKAARSGDPRKRAASGKSRPRKR